MTDTTNVFNGGECDIKVWVLNGRVAPLSWWFSGRSVSASSSSGILSSLIEEKGTVGHEIFLGSLSAILCISSSLLMCPARSGVLTGLVGDFSSDLT